MVPVRKKQRRSLPVLELSIERRCVRLVKLRGGRILKLQHLKGWPDRLLLYRRQVKLIEFKRPKLGRLSPLQRLTLGWLAENGFDPRVIDNVLDFAALLTELDCNEMDA